MKTRLESQVISKIYFNWFATPENGEEFSEFVVGGSYHNRGVCIKIEENRPGGDGDRWFYDVYFETETYASKERIFNINRASYFNHLK